MHFPCVSVFRSILSLLLYDHLACLTFSLLLSYLSDLSERAIDCALNVSAIGSRQL